MKQKNGKRRWLSLLLTACMVLSFLPAAGVHSYAEACETHDMKYWPEGDKDSVDHTLKCANCDAWDWENHSYDSIEDDDCNICGYIVTCSGHSFETNRYDRNKDTHVRECDHCVRTDESTREVHADEDDDDLCDACRWHFAECTFVWTDASEIYGNLHYLFCECGETEWQEHVDENQDNRCDVCTYCMDGVHTFICDPEKDRDVSTHRKHCQDCGFKSDWEAHSDTDSDYRCDVCGICMHDVHSDPVWDQGEVFSDQHRVVCENCGSTYLEDHDTHGENGACSICGYLDTTVGICLALRALAAETGFVIDGSVESGMLDAKLSDENESWVENYEPTECYLDYMESHTLDFRADSYCPEGYLLPEDVTFTIDANGSITITSDNAEVEVAEGVTYIIVRLPREPAHEHTYEVGYYHSEGDYHYKECDLCDYYDPDSKEEHYEADSSTDHCCDACEEYWRGFCTPVDAETGHYCVNGENCGARLDDLCTDEDQNHICDGCEERIDGACHDEDNDHLCDGENCDVRLSACADDNDDGKCDACGKTFAAVTVRYTAIAYEAEGEDVFASGTLQVTADVAGTITAAWGYDGLAKVTGEPEAGVPADLIFADVPLDELDFVELTFTPDDEDTAAVTLEHYIEWDLVKLNAEALTGYDEEIRGTFVARTFINGIACEELYLFPGTAVTVQTNLLPTDSWQVGEFEQVNYRPVGIVEGTEGKFYYEDAEGEIIYAAVAIAGDTISFTLPAEVGDRAWVKIFCTHGECVDSDGDHWCDSTICDDWIPGADANSDNRCDVCGEGMFLRNDGVKDCGLAELLDNASDGDTFKLLADNNIAGGEYWYDAVWFNPDEDITVTVDLNGFILSVTEAKYLLGVGNGTLKIIDSSEGKTGRLRNPQGSGILDLDGGVFDLSGYPDPTGITVHNYQDVPAGVSGHTGTPVPIRLILPEGYAVTVEVEGKLVCSSQIPAGATATVVELPKLALDGGSKVLHNAHLLAKKVFIAGYLDGQLKAVQVVETVTPEIVIDDQVLAYVAAQGGEVKAFLLDGSYAPSYDVLTSE